MDTPSPVVLMPGIRGSQLWARLAKDSPNKLSLKEDCWYQIWMSDNDLFNSPEMAQYLKYNPENDSPRELEIEASNFGKVCSVASLGEADPKGTLHMGPLIDYLESNLGLVKDISIVAAPYDFRCLFVKENLQVYYEKLEKLIEETCSQAGKPCVLITHSLGCVLSSMFLSQASLEWKKKNIKHWVSVGGCFGGFTKVLKYILAGDCVEGLISNIPSPKTHAAVFRASPTSFAVIPQTIGGVERQVLKYNGQPYTTEQYEEFFERMNIPVPWKFRYNILEHSNIEVPSSHFYSTGIPTVSLVSVEEKNGEFDFDYEYEDGDGIVSTWSMCAAKSLGSLCNFHEIKGVNHFAVLIHPEFLSSLTKLLH